MKTKYPKAFLEWYAANRNSEDLLANYGECCADFYRCEDVAPSFKQFCFEEWTAQQEAPSGSLL